MTNLTKKQKFVYFFAIFSALIFIGFAAFKVNRMVSVYEAGSKSIQMKMGDIAAKIRTGELDLSAENIAIILEASADRKLEDGVINWFKTYLFLFIFMFGGSMVFLLAREIRNVKNTTTEHPY